MEHSVLTDVTMTAIKSSTKKKLLEKRGEFLKTKLIQSLVSYFYEYVVPNF